MKPLMSNSRFDNSMMVLNDILNHVDRTAMHVVFYTTSLENIPEVVTPYLEKHGRAVAIAPDGYMAGRVQYCTSKICEGKTDVLFMPMCLIEGWSCNSPRKVVVHLMFIAGADKEHMRRIQLQAEGRFIRVGADNETT